MIKFLTMLSIFVLIVQLILFHLKEEHRLELRLYILENLIDSKPKLENEELSQKVNEIYKLISGK